MSPGKLGTITFILPHLPYAGGDYTDKHRLKSYPIALCVKIGVICSTYFPANLSFALKNQQKLSID